MYLMAASKNVTKMSNCIKKLILPGNYVKMDWLEITSGDKRLV